MKYKEVVCDVCDQSISSGGAARCAHMRKHVREGKLEEIKKNGKLEFVRLGVQLEYVEPDPYAMLGNEPEQHQPVGVFEITEALKNLPAIDPNDYYSTSGEAIKKAEKLVSDVYSLAVRARAFKNKLEKSKAEAKYLETQWENGRLLIKRKSPRNKNGNKKVNKKGT